MGMEIKDFIQRAVLTKDDFPFNLIMALAATNDPIEGDDAELINCAVRYYDAKYAGDKKATEEATKELRKLIGVEDPAK